MSDSPRPAGPSFPVGWLLLLLVPVGLLAGQLIAGLPIPAAKPAGVGSRSASSLPGGGRGSPHGGAATPGHSPSSGGQLWGQAPDAQSGGAPAEAATKPREEPQTQKSLPQGGGGVRWLSLNAAMEEARISGKPVLIDFSADWCGPCKRMKREVFENPTHARAVEAAVVSVSIVDRYRESGANPPEIEELQRRFGVDGFPTLVVLSGTTGRFVKTAGFGGADYTTQWIASAAQQVR